MESLGNKLRSARETKGLSYDYVSRETNISSRYLDALEREDFSGFPGEPYVLGFLRNYAEYLGLNPDELQSLYRSLKIQEQPIPVEALLKRPSPLPKIITGIAIAIAVLGIGTAVYFVISRFPQKTSTASDAPRKPVEYTLNTDYLERRLYPEDSIIVSDGIDSYKLVFSNLGDAVTIATPKGPVMLDLGQEVTIDLSNTGSLKLRIIASDFAKNDSNSGALLRFEQMTMIQTASGVILDDNLQVNASQISDSEREPSTVVFSSPNAYPFTLQAVFQGYCLFRYEILFERDRPGRNEQYYQRSEEISISAQNGIRLGISNAQAVKLQVIGGGRNVSLETGGAGEVVAADLRWVRDEDNRYRLVLMQLD